MAWGDDLSDDELLTIARKRGVVKADEDPLATMSDADLRLMAIERGLLPKIGAGKAAALGAADAVNFNTTDELAGRGAGVWATIKRATSGDRNAQGRLLSAAVEPFAPALKAVQGVMDPEARAEGQARAALNRARASRWIQGKASAEDKQALGEGMRESADFATSVTAPFSPLAKLRLLVKASERASDPETEAATLAAVRTDQTRAREERPLVYYGSGVAAGLATPGLGSGAVKSVGNAAKAAMAVKSPAALKALTVIAKTAAKGAGAGLAYGTAAGIGDAEGDLKDRIQEAASPNAALRNAALGGGGALAFGGALGAGQLMLKAGSWAARKLARSGAGARQAEILDGIYAPTTGQVDGEATGQVAGELRLPDLGEVGAGQKAADVARAKAAASAQGGEFFNRLNLPHTQGQAMGDEGEMAWERLAASGMFGDDVRDEIAPVFKRQAEAFIEEAPRVVAPKGELETLRETDAAASVIGGVRDLAGYLRTQRDLAYDEFGGRKTTLPKTEPSKLAPQIEDELERAGIIDRRPAQLREKGLEVPDRTDLPALYSDTYRALDHIRAVTQRMDADPKFRTLQNLEPTRVVLNELMKKAAKNEDGLDLRGLTIIKNLFDDWERSAFERAGKLSKKGERELPIMLEARAAHGRMAQFEGDPALKHIISDPKANEATVLDKLFGAGGVNAKTGSVGAVRAIKEAAYRRVYSANGGELPAEHINPRDLAAFSEPWQALREAAMHRLIGSAEKDLERAGAQGMPWGRIAKQLDAALNGSGAPLMRELFTPEELGLLQQYQQAAARFAIKSNGQNASGTALAQAQAVGPMVDRLLKAVGSSRIPFSADVATGIRARINLAKARQASGNAPAKAPPRDLAGDLRRLLSEGLQTMQPYNVDGWPEMAGAANARAYQDTNDERDFRRERTYGQ